MPPDHRCEGRVGSRWRLSGGRRTADLTAWLAVMDVERGDGAAVASSGGRSGVCVVSHADLLLLLAKELS